LILRDRSPERPNGLTLEPLQVCSRGPDTCQLGMSEDEVYKEWTKFDKDRIDSGLFEGGYIFSPNKPGPYKAAVVWFDADRKVSRVVGIHDTDRQLNQAEVPAQLEKAWISELVRLGHPRRLLTNGAVVTDYLWRDDTTRIHLFSHKHPQHGILILTEWRPWK